MTKTCTSCHGSGTKLNRKTVPNTGYPGDITIATWLTKCECVAVKKK